MISTIAYNAGYENVISGKTTVVKYKPNGNFTQLVQQGDSIRFNLDRQNGLLDPLSTYMETTVSFDNNMTLLNDTTYTNKIIQLDHSAHSLFSALIITAGGKELERIMEFDVLNCFLNDMNWGSGDRGMRDWEGAGTVFTPGLPNVVLTSFAVPSANTGTSQQLKNWVPWQGTTSTYVDTSSRIYAVGTTTTGAYASSVTNNYSIQHPIINNRLAFNPIGFNDAAVTWSGGTNVTETYNDFSAATPLSNPAAHGCAQYFTPDFCKTGFETFFSKTVLQRYMYNGFVKTDFITQATFYTKLRSGILGELMPIERLRLIPLWLLPDLSIQLYFSEHAFFTSWFTSNQRARAYQIINMTLYTTQIIPTDAVTAAIDGQFNAKGIEIVTQTFTLGPRLNVVNGAIPQTISIGLKIGSLRDFFFCFGPNDHLAAANIRKQQRFSMGITSYQLRVGLDLYPLEAISGNAGTNHGPINNWQMLQYTYTCFGKHCGPSSTMINSQNFAISCTSIDPTNVPGINDNAQLSFLENQRYRGASLFGIPCDKLNLNQGTLGGISTREANPFDLMIYYAGQKIFPRPVTMYTYIHHDIAIKMSPSSYGIEIELYR